eukprot:FR738179.1.p1 GENE.FR738179.1~~FR738179.1.p1  ORF type:complete len:112 (-),score=8.15 FR738179.1:141-476(-)
MGHGPIPVTTARSVVAHFPDKTPTTWQSLVTTGPPRVPVLKRELNVAIWPLTFATVAGATKRSWWCRDSVKPETRRVISESSVASCACFYQTWLPTGWLAPTRIVSMQCLF